MNAVFITGTDTGVGKTVVTGLLGRYLLDQGYSVITQKWVQTGANRFSPDIETHWQIMKIKKPDVGEDLPYVCPYVFRSASSPHLAARLEKRKISADKIKKSFMFLQRRFDFVLVEGTGGALAPFNGKKLVIDIARDLNLPVLVVAANKLGAINHTLLTLEALAARKMKILGVVFNNPAQKGNKAILGDNPSIVQAISKMPVLGILPRQDMYREFIPIGKKIYDGFLKKSSV